jgi:hypothetical protein
VVKDVDKIAAENKVVRRPEIQSADIETRQLRCRPCMLSTISRSPIWISVSIGSALFCAQQTALSRLSLSPRAT